MPEKAVDMPPNASVIPNAYAIPNASVIPNAYAIPNASVIPNLFRNLKINTMIQFARAIDRNLIVRCKPRQVGVLAMTGKSGWVGKGKIDSLHSR
jgi:hypothetical protein